MGPRSRKYVKGYGLMLFATNLSSKYKNQLLDTGLYSVKTACKKVVHKKTANAVAQSYDNKIVKKKHVTDKNPRNFAEIIIPPEKREEILNELRQVL